MPYEPADGVVVVTEPFVDHDRNERRVGEHIDGGEDLCEARGGERSPKPTVVTAITLK
jgi:hypothetical protein